MKIIGLRTELFEFPLARVMGDANSPQGRNRAAALAIFLETDEGLTGVSVGSPGTRGLVESLGRLLEGRDPRGVAGLWAAMADSQFKTGNEGLASQAIGAVDIAVWDLKAKAAGEPLWKTLGAGSRYVRVYASGIELPLPDDEMHAFYAGMAKQGVTAGKLKVGLDRQTDMKRIGVMRDALGSAGGTPELMVDANEYWSPKQAIATLKFYERRYDLLWAEEPARRWDWRGLRQVSRAVTAAVATGENLKSVRDFLPLLEHEAVDVVQVGSNTSGISGARQVAEVASAFERPVAMMNSPGNVMAHLAAALPNHQMLELAEMGWEQVLEIDQRLEDGWLILGDTPGHGLEFKREALAGFRVDQVSPAAQPSPTGRRRGAGLYAVPPEQPREQPGTE